MDSTYSLVLFLLVSVILSLVAGIVLGKTEFLGEKNKLPKWLKYAAGIVIFGVLSILGTVFGVSENGIFLNSRDLGPIVGGVWFGPVIGIGAGIIGAAFRLTAGGTTVIPCTIATLLAGFLAAGVYLWVKKNGHRMTILISVITAVVIELIHLLLAVLIVPDGIAIVLSPVGIGTLISAVFCVFIFSLAYKLSLPKTEN